MKENEIIFYTTNCPMCMLLEKELKKSKLEYTSCNDVDIMQSKGLSHAPALEVNGKIMELKEALAYLRSK